MHNLAYRYKHSYSFTRGELNQLLITSLVVAFILSFTKWGGKEFSFLIGLMNLIAAFVATTAFLYAHVFIQKIVGLKIGYFPSYNAYPTMLIVGVILTFFSNGTLPFFITGTLTYSISERMRTGRHRRGYTLWEASLVSFAGPITSILIAGLLGVLYKLTQSEFVFGLIITNLLLAIYAMLPVPRLYKPKRKKTVEVAGALITGSNPLYHYDLREGGPAGLHVLMHSRTLFVLTFSMTLFYAGLIFTTKTFGLALALLLAILTAVAYYYLVEEA